MKKKPGAKPFSLRERSIIEVRWCRDGITVTDIADELGRNKSSVSREIGGKPRQGRGRYDGDIAHRKALARIKKRGNTPKMRRCEGLRVYVEEKLKLGWSPEQISLRLPIDYKDDETMRISHEAVYQEVYRRPYRGGNGSMKPGTEDLRPYLARRHRRRAKKGFRKAQKAERSSCLPSIEIRPKVVEKRSRIGDWEDDTMVSRQSATRIKSTNERKSGVVLFRKTKNGTAEVCDQALITALASLPKTVRHTLTRDRGTENVKYEQVVKELKIDVFFAHPYCSHERGSNENCNGLFRRFFPKKTDFDKVSEQAIAQVEYLLNTRPRKRFGGLTPVEVFYEETGVALYS